MKKILFSALAAMALLASCSKDGAKEDNNQAQAGSEAYVSLRLVNPAARADTPDPNARTEEQGFSKINIFFYDANGYQLSGANGAIEVDATVTSASYDKTTLVAKVKTTTAARWVFAGVNLSAATVTSLTGKPMSALNAETLNPTATATAPKLASATDIKPVYATDNGFVMTGIVQPVSLQPAPAANTPISYDMDRLSVKVVTIHNGSNVYTSAIDGSTATVTGWRVRNVNKTQYLMRHNNAAQTVVYDPNYSGWKVGGGAPAAGEYGATSFFRYINNWKSAVAKQTNGKDYTVADVEYITENTSEKHYQGESSYVVIKAIYSPAEYMNNEGGGVWTGGNPRTIGNDDFFVIRNFDGSNLNVFYFQSLADAEQFTQDKLGIVLPADEAEMNKMIDHYTDGVCLYYAWLGAAQTESNQWDVVRNDFITVKINSIKGPGRSTWTDKDGDGDDDEGDDGDDDPDEDDEENPDDPDEPIVTEANADLDVIINPWKTFEEGWDF